MSAVTPIREPGFSFADYAKHGWVLTPIEPGRKSPTGHGWNLRENCFTHPLAAAQLKAAGLCHRYAGTCAIDLDNIQVAQAWLAERGVDLEALLLDPRAVQIRSPRKGHAKLLYRLETPLRTLQLAPYADSEGKTKKALELRCATADGLTVQDLLPPSPYPDGGFYVWAGDGDWRCLPPLPAELHSLWQALASAEPTKLTSVEPTVDKHVLSELLDGIDPDIGYDDWIVVGQAIHHEHGGSEEGFKQWHAWSAKGGKYKGEADLRPHWRSFTAGGGITGQSLFRLQRCTPDEFPIVPPIQAPRASQSSTVTLPIESVLMTAPELKPIEFVIDGFIATGLTTIAGTEGVGKTSLLVPLAAAAAHLIQTGFPIELRRKVVYVAEDTSQVERVLYGLWKHAPLAASWDEWQEWFVLLPAKRVSGEVWGATIAALVDHHGVEANGYRVGPLIVLDTANATLDVESENDNAEVGRAIAWIKENLRNAACWLVTHVPKALSRKDVEDLVIRGANAWSADANATAYIFRDEKIAELYPDRRFMLTRKVRFERQLQEIQFGTAVHCEERPTPWGSMQSIAYRYGLPSSSSAEDRKEAAAQVAAEREARRESEIRDELIQLAREHESLTKSEARKAIKKNTAAISAAFNELITEGLFVEAARPSTKGGKRAQAYALVEHARLETMSTGVQMHEIKGVQA